VFPLASPLFTSFKTPIEVLISPFVVYPDVALGRGPLDEQRTTGVFKLLSTLLYLGGGSPYDPEDRIVCLPPSLDFSSFVFQEVCG